MGEENTRKVWFITRPERDPAFHEDALKALAIATDNFSVVWSGNRDAHKKYEQALIDMKIKRNSISNDGSGGRTWAALLKTFSYCYPNSNGYLVPTKVALEILKGNNIFENIKKQILTLQIPNAYFLENGFKPKYDDNFAILPARFLIRLCTSQELSHYITKEEITFIVMTTEKENQFNEVISKILAFRNMSSEEKSEFKATVSSTYDHRERSDKGARDYSGAHSDVAHTFMLIAEYTGLVEYDRGKDSKLLIKQKKVESTIAELEYYDSRYPLNNKYLFSLERMAEVNGLDIKSFKASRLGDIKPASNTYKKIKKAEKILSNYPNASDLKHEDLVEILSTSSFSVVESQKIAEYMVSSSVIENLDDEFVQSVLNEPDNLEFENKIGKILMQFGFKVTMHPKINGERTEIDILVKYGENLCGVIDAKNYKEKFSLSASMASHMASEYIPNYVNYDGSELKFYGYVTCNDIGGTSNLSKITTRTTNNIGTAIEGFMINAKTLLALLDYCIEEEIPVNERVALFTKLVSNESYTSFGQVLNKL